MNPTAHKWAIALGLSVLATGPAFFALGWVPGLAGREARTFVAGVERALALLFLVLAVVFAWRSRVRAQSQAQGQAKEAGAGSASGWEWSFLLPLVPVAFFGIFLTERAYAGLLLWDKDYAGISAALANTASGWGFLAAPHFETGSTTSYLGHHFAPGLSGFLPFYWLAEVAEGSFAQFDHRLYGWLLAASFAGGLFVWGRVFMESVGRSARAFVVLPLVFAFPLLRLLQSFHYETPVLLFSGLAVWGLRRQSRWLIWGGAVGWVLWKEDMGAYVALLGAALFLGRETRRLGLTLTLFGMGTLLASMALRAHLAGPSGPQWNYLAGLFDRAPAFWPFASVVLGLGGLSFFAPRVFLIAVVPVALLHAWSSHAWHQSYLGHYGYAILPLLLFATAEGLANLEWRLGSDYLRAIAAGAVSVCLYFAGAEKEAPVVLPPPDPLQSVARRILADIPRGACAQLDARFTAQAPLGVLTVPYFLPARNPLAGQFLDLRRLGPEARPEFPDRCVDFFVLVDTARPPPYEGQGEHAFIVRELFRTGQPVKAEQTLVLLRFARAPERQKGTNFP